jgi:hypothetical protein
MNKRWGADKEIRPPWETLKLLCGREAELYFNGGETGFEFIVLFLQSFVSGLQFGSPLCQGFDCGKVDAVDIYCADALVCFAETEGCFEILSGGADVAD